MMRWWSLACTVGMLVGAVACGGDDDDDDVSGPDAGFVDPGGPQEPFPDHYCPGSDGCTGEGDGVFRAGAARVSIVPVIEESEWVDEDGDFHYDIGEDFTDVNGNGDFDPIWMAGLSNSRPAVDVNDGLWATAVVLEWNDIRIAIVSLDVVGWFITEIENSEARLPASLEIDHLVVGSTHNHEGADTIGLWGQQELSSGINDDYQELVRQATVDAVEAAAAALEPVAMSVAQAKTVDETGSALPFVSDDRDPRILDPRITLLQFTSVAEPDRTVATIVNWAAHPEYAGKRHNSLSSDIVHYVRDTIRNGAPATAAGPAVEGIGGEVLYVQGALGGQIGPQAGVAAVAADGSVLTEHSFPFAEAAGVNVGRIALQAITDADVVEDVADPELAFQTGAIWLVVENVFYHVAAFVRVFDRQFIGYDEDAPIDEGNMPYIPSRVSYLRIGNVGIVTCPGELHPELFIGGYDGSQSWGHDLLQSDVPNPPDLANAPTGPFLQDYILMKDGVEYALVFGVTQDFIGYVVPSWNYVLHETTPYLEEAEGDHYEETNSVGPLVEEQVVGSMRRLIQFEP